MDQNQTNEAQHARTKETHEEIMATLAEDASYFRPSLFSVYGVDRSGHPFLGWGMQMGEHEAFYCQPGMSTTWISSSAEQVHATLTRTGEAHLRWLED